MKALLQPWPVISRVLAAIFGGYLFTYCLTAAQAQLLPMTKPDAVITATLSAFVVYTLVILWTFGCRSAWRAWAILPLALPLAAIGFWPQLVERIG